MHEVGEHEGLPYLVSDFVGGLTLADFLTGRRPAPREAARLVAEVADALRTRRSAASSTGTSSPRTS